ncbi:hypothetical protein P153DRAFT_400400 [Dothidotthia symphoricarpi CBS 119687]|uniref:Uncharacterized protein n=1 Tax=Dothidotthia symphoricarpi CBS 119687 TaxID=1392245 RepID=A0A6A6A4S6_9PLEO|nr:uncharacterized protein P153DRAFT_400400 [Dothidotthia symphoricarpi CBS 119687]KAF2125601.1 hypothetical protein P153DRAFT_400400 [Dothidotthia symphoricarpi CBS 119687]
MSLGMSTRKPTFLPAYRRGIALHESFWRSQKLPDTFPPRNASSATNSVRIVVWGTHPQARSDHVVNMINYADVNISSTELGMFSYPVEFLCEGNVYALDITELPQPEAQPQALLSMFQQFAFILVYTVTSFSSFKDAQNQFGKLLATMEVGIDNHPFPIMILGLTTELGTSSDLPTQQASRPVRQVPTYEGRSFAETRGCLFAESSAQVFSDIIGVFAAIVERINHASSNRAPGFTPAAAEELARKQWIVAVDSVPKDSRKHF